MIDRSNVNEMCVIVKTQIAYVFPVMGRIEGTTAIHKSTHEYTGPVWQPVVYGRPDNLFVALVHRYVEAETLLTRLGFYPAHSYGVGEAWLVQP